MGLLEIIAVLITLAAVFSYFNHRFLGLPTTIGLMIISLVFSLGLITAGQFVPSVEEDATNLLASIDFSETLLHGMLGYLLFAGALHVDIDDLLDHKWTIGTLASLGVLLSTLTVAGLTFGITRALGIELRFIHCLLFGALISPTDPIAVLSILKSLGVPKSLETQISGESLFNDGVGMVVFLGVLSFAGAGGGHGAEEASAASIAVLFVQEAFGGAIFGFAIGWIAYQMLKSVDNYQVEILISLAIVTGGYVLAYNLHLSGPIAMVVAGLMIGNHGRRFAMSEKTREHLDTFWELVDEILNAVLFVLIGLEVLLLAQEWNYIAAGLLAIPAALLARFMAVGAPTAALSGVIQRLPHGVKLMTWGGLRGGISVALALSLRDFLKTEERAVTDAILVMTYVVVAFSIIVQGLTMKPLIERLLPSRKGQAQ